MRKFFLALPVVVFAVFAGLAFLELAALRGIFIAHDLSPLFMRRSSLISS